MARRERTTALPRPHPRRREASGRTIFGLRWDEGGQRFAILGAAIALLVFVVGWLAFRLYDDNVRLPNSTVLTVASDHVSLRYYSERLSKFVKDAASSQTPTNLGISEQEMLSTLEDEALTVQLAKANGIAISNNDINAAIGTDIGVASGGSLSAFDSVYRQALSTAHMSDSTYRRMTTASVANQKLTDLFAGQVADTGELVTLRAIVVDSNDAAAALLPRIAAGEDMGTIAQTTSLDDSKNSDGLMAAQPPPLLPQPIQDAIAGKQAGSDVLGPIQVDQQYWVFRIEKRDPNGTVTSDMKQQVGQQKLTDSLNNSRQQTKIVRSLSTRDVKWAEAHVQ
jgi:parvulin-like peptidyl-prolyl isomerase